MMRKRLIREFVESLTFNELGYLLKCERSRLEAEQARLAREDNERPEGRVFDNLPDAIAYRDRLNRRADRN